MARIKLEFDGLDEMVKRLEEQGKNLKSTANEALEETFKAVTPGIKAIIPSHRFTGATESSLITSPTVVWNGNVGEVKVGFDLNKEISSQFLIYGAKASVTGVPYRKPDMKLWNAIFGTSITREIEKIQKEVFERELMK